MKPRKDAPRNAMPAAPLTAVGAGGAQAAAQ